MLATLPIVNAHIRSDGNAYFAYVRSIVIDHDLHFDNEYAAAEPSFQQATVDELILLPSGYRRNHTASGASLVWLPFFVTAHELIPVLRARGIAVAADGFSWPYVWACAAGGACLVFLGLWWAYRMALRVASPNAALLATITIWWASSLPVYLYFLPFHAHALASFAVSWFLWNWLRINDGALGRGRWFVWGMSAGLMTAIYYVNGMLLVIAAIEWVRQAVKPGKFRAVAINTLWMGAGALLAALPDIIIKRILQGQFFNTGYTGYTPKLFFWNDPRLWSVAFSSEHGFVLWTPAIAVALLGLLWAIWKAPTFAAPLAVGCAAFIYAIAAYLNWHGHSSFGNRFLVSLTPMYVIGLAALLSTLLARAGRRGWVAAWAVGLLVIAWNVGLMFQWGTNIIPNPGPVDMRVAARNQVTVVPTTIAQFVRRYVTDRAGVVGDVEKQDLSERAKFTIKR